MTQLEFINKTREAYLNARNYIYTPNLNVEILSRGTSHAISSVTEDLFGCYCANKVHVTSDIKIFIDPPVSFKGTDLKNKSKKKSLLVRPDLMITKNNIATCFFDIKTDLGYKRKDFYNQAFDKNSQIELIKGQKASTNHGQTKVRNEFTVSDDAKFIYIVISQGNIKRSIQQDFIRDIRLLPNVEIFLLTTGDHLNSYRPVPRWEINKEDFDSLDDLLDKYLNR